jgi:hypothetical protein
MYAAHASSTFNTWLHQQLSHLASDLKKVLNENLVALILGGGYGRGEGGVVRSEQQERPYNDLDLFLIVRKTNIRLEALNSIVHKYESRMQIEIDFSRPLTTQDISKWPNSLMWKDLFYGHKVLFGSNDILMKHAPSCLREELPPIEATRLLLNRGSGLLWAWRVVRGLEDAPDTDFVRRNYYKCALALGDALLIVNRRFSTAYRGRDERLQGLLSSLGNRVPHELGELYSTSLLFKFSPDHVVQSVNRGQIAQLADLWRQIFFYVEQQRSGIKWPSLEAYSKWAGIRETARNGIGERFPNLVRNLRHGVFSTRYPREDLYRKLPGLLCRGKIQANDWNTKGEDFLRIWSQFN